MTTKILIDVQGGLVQEVFSTGDVEVTLIDWDNTKEGCETEFITHDNYSFAPVSEQELQKKIDEVNQVVTDNIKFINGDDNSESLIHIVTEKDQKINYGKDDMMKNYCVVLSNMTGGAMYKRKLLFNKELDYNWIIILNPEQIFPQDCYLESFDTLGEAEKFADNNY